MTGSHTLGFALLGLTAFACLIILWTMGPAAGARSRPSMALMQPATNVVARSVHKRRVHERQRGASRSGGSPRGIKKHRLGAELWLGDIGPSDELKKWFGHVPIDGRSPAAASDQPQQREPLGSWSSWPGPLTLLYGARDTERNQPV